MEHGVPAMRVSCQQSSFTHSTSQAVWPSLSPVLEPLSLEIAFLCPQNASQSSADVQGAWASPQDSAALYAQGSAQAPATHQPPPLHPCSQIPGTQWPHPALLNDISSLDKVVATMETARSRDPSTGSSKCGGWGMPGAGGTVQPQSCISV